MYVKNQLPLTMITAQTRINPLPGASGKIIFKQQIPTGSITAPLEIYALDSMKVKAHNVDLHRHNHFEIVWVIQGKGRFLIDFDEFEINDNLIFCLDPGRIHRFNLYGNVNGYIISFQREFLENDSSDDKFFFNKVFHESKESHIIEADPYVHEGMIGIMKSMQFELNDLSPLYNYVLQGFLKIFLIYLTRHKETVFTSSSKSVSSILTKKFLVLLEDKYSTFHKVSQYADELAVTPNYLNEMVKKESGLTVSTNIQQRIVLEAKRMAVSKNLSLKETAYSLGFEDLAHFSKFFKTVSGSNYTQFKQAMKM